MNGRLSSSARTHARHFGEPNVIVPRQIRETRKPMERIGVRIGKRTRDVRLQKNRIDGFRRDVVDLKAQP